MPTPPTRFIPVLSALPFLLLLASRAPGRTDERSLHLAPTRVDAGKAFDLEVLGYRWDCGATYSRFESTRNGGRLSLRFVVTRDPQAVCPAIVKPYGPKVPMAALPAGRYDVHVTPILPCHAAPMPCDAPEKEERAGILTVGRPAEADWFVSPAATSSGKPFTLRILSDRYGNCHTRFDHAGLTVSNGRITADFVVKTDFSIDCIVDIRPHGPAFQVEALPAGKYPVDVIETPECVHRNPACPWLPPEMAARTVDTLVVSGPTDLRPHARGPAARSRGGARLERGKVKREGTARSLQGRSLQEARP